MAVYTDHGLGESHVRVGVTRYVSGQKFLEVRYWHVECWKASP
jgi:hypothetical protein